MTSPEYANRLRANIFSWLSRKTSDYGTQNIPEISAAIGTDLGQSRKDNQDYGAVAKYSGHSVADSWTAFALCDGIGGLRDGGVCARTATAVLFTSLLQSRIPDVFEKLSGAASAANDEVYAAYREQGGTTLTCVLIDGQSHSAGLSVGDSRLYEYTGNSLAQISSDDILSNQVDTLPTSESGILSRFGRQLTQFIGMGKDVQFHKIAVGNTVDQQGLLLTSDGLHAPWGAVLGDITLHAPTPFDVVRRLMALSRWGPGHDNATVLCISKARAAHTEVPITPGTLAIWDSFSRLDLIIDCTVLRAKTSAQKPPTPVSAPKRDSEKPSQEGKGGTMDKPTDTFNLQIIPERDVTSSD